MKRLNYQLFHDKPPIQRFGSGCRLSILRKEKSLRKSLLCFIEAFPNFLEMLVKFSRLNDEATKRCCVTQQKEKTQERIRIENKCQYRESDLVYNYSPHNIGISSEVGHACKLTIRKEEGRRDSYSNKSCYYTSNNLISG